VEKPLQDELQDATPLEDAGVDYSTTEQDDLLLRRQPFWKKIGGDGLVVSIVIHVVLLILFGAWVVSSWTDTAKTDPDTFATGAGGGAAGDKAKIFEHKLQPKNAKTLAKTSARITSKSSSSTLALPDIPTTSSPSLLSGMTSGGSSKGFGGGSGGGIGSGKGAGVGNGKNFVGLFGAKFGTNGLTGTFYDLKQDNEPKPQPTKMMGPAPEQIGPQNAGAVVEFVKQVHAFVDSRWSEQKLRAYYQAPDKLIGTQFFIPARSANAAPAAYGVADKVRPSRWVAHYKGRIKAPVTGKFRFVGFGDDLLVVRWENKVALDAGYDAPSIDSVTVVHAADAERIYDDFSGKPRIPQIAYLKSLPNAPSVNFRAGPWIDVVAGTSYGMEVLVGETPGGVFCCYLGIEVSTGKKVANVYQGEEKIRIFKIGREDLPDEIKDGAGTGWEMNPGDWTFEPANSSGPSGSSR
jgi:hypothetical protein